MAVTSLNFLPTFLQYFNLYIYCKNVGKIFRLVTAMHRNGPLPQVSIGFKDNMLDTTWDRFLRFVAFGIDHYQAITDMS